MKQSHPATLTSMESSEVDATDGEPARPRSDSGHRAGLGLLQEEDSQESSAGVDEAIGSDSFPPRIHVSDSSDAMPLPASPGAFSSSSGVSPLKVLGRHGLYLASSQPFFHARLRHMFPRQSTRIAAVVSLVLAVVGGLAWSILTIQTKWVRDIHHPTTTLNSVELDRVPALPGLLTFWQSDYWWNGTLANTMNLTDSGAVLNPMTPLPTYTPPRPVPSHGYKFHQSFLGRKRSTAEVQGATGFSDSVLLGRQYACGAATDIPRGFVQTEFCVPEDVWPAVFTGAQEWPLYFGSTMDTLCIHTYALLDPRALVEVDAFDRNATNRISFNRMKFQTPITYLSLMDLDVLQSSSASSSSAASDTLLQANLWSRPISVAYNHRNAITARMSQRIDVTGRVTWHTELEFSGSLAFTQATVEEAFQAFWQDNPALYAELSTDPNLDLTNRSRTQLHYAETCFGAGTLKIPVVEETRVYSALNFLSDLGGFLSLVSILFALSFPLREVFLIPRTWILGQGWTWLKKICWEEDDDSIGPGGGTDGSMTQEEEEYSNELYSARSSRHGGGGGDSRSSSAVPTPLNSTSRGRASGLAADMPLQRFYPPNQPGSSGRGGGPPSDGVVRRSIVSPTSGAGPPLGSLAPVPPSARQRMGGRSPAATGAADDDASGQEAAGGDGQFMRAAQVNLLEKE